MGVQRVRWPIRGLVRGGAWLNLRVVRLGGGGGQVSIETCYQNTGVALTVALSSFHGETQHRAAGVPVFYMACQVRFFRSLFQVAFSAPGGPRKLCGGSCEVHGAA
jgi:hypothetical protein